MSFRYRTSWGRKTKEEPDLEGEKLYTLNWEIQGAWTSETRQFTGSKREMLDALKTVKHQVKAGRVVNIALHETITSFDRKATGEDGHYHYIDDVPQHHTWNECPENHENKSV